MPVEVKLEHIADSIPEIKQFLRPRQKKLQSKDTLEPLS